MLTNDDLSAIRQVVKEEAGVVIKKELRRELNPIKKELKQLRSDLNVVISTFDNDIIETKLRVDRVETHLHLSPIASHITQ